MVIAEEIDKDAWRKWRLYNDGADVEALKWRRVQGAKDSKGDETSTANRFADGAMNLGRGALVGSFEKVAAMLDEAAGAPGRRGSMLAFDEYADMVDKSGQRVQPLMKSKEAKV